MIVIFYLENDVLHPIFFVFYVLNDSLYYNRKKIENSL